MQVGITQQLAFDLKRRLLRREIKKGCSFRRTFQLRPRFRQAAMAFAYTGRANEKRCVHDAECSGGMIRQKGEMAKQRNEKRLSLRKGALSRASERDYSVLLAFLQFSL